MNYLNRKKGYTLAELLITILIIAVISSATVISYIALKKKADKSNGEAIVAQFNRALAYDFNNSHSTLLEAVKTLKNSEVNFAEEVEKLNGFYMAYCADENKFILCDEAEAASKNKTGGSVWVAADSENKLLEYGKNYSVYITNEFTADSVTLNYGYDAGESGGVTGTVTIKNETETGDIICRAGGNEKFIFNAPNARIIYYGDREDIIECSAAKITYMTDFGGSSDGSSSEGSGSGEETTIQPTAYDGSFMRCDADGEANSSGEYALFGLFPQSVVGTEESSSLSEKHIFETALPKEGEENNSSGWTSYEYYCKSSVSHYMWYKDVDADGDNIYDYRAVYFTEYRENKISGSTKNRQETNGYTTKTVYWFKYEPLLWKIIAEEDGEYTLLSEKIIDCGQFSASGSVNYAESDLKSSLNDKILNSAFTSALQEKISDDDLNGKIFAISIKTASALTTENLKKSPTDYAKAQGLYVSGDYGTWWTSSAYDETNCCYVSYDGSASAVKTSPIYTDVGFVPALKIKTA